MLGPQTAPSKSRFYLEVLHCFSLPDMGPLALCVGGLREPFSARSLCHVSPRMPLQQLVLFIRAMRTLTIGKPLKKSPDLDLLRFGQGSHLNTFHLPSHIAPKMLMEKIQ